MHVKSRMSMATKALTSLVSEQEGRKGNLSAVGENLRSEDRSFSDLQYKRKGVEKCNFSDVLYRKSRSAMTREE